MTKSEFITSLRKFLGKHGARITAEDHWSGYAECGSDIRMTIEFDDYSIPDIDLGGWIDEKGHGGRGPFIKWVFADEDDKHRWAKCIWRILKGIKRRGG